MRPLFVAGCPRSGTTALTEYLNQHEELLVCIERYKYAPPPQELTPNLFTFDRILDYREGETNTPKERHEKLLARKDPAKLKWIGDKRGMYFKWFEQLAENNPGARFIVIHRPVEEVAESFEARKKNPKDHWWADSREAVDRWNLALRRTREFVESGRGPVLILHYHDFVYRNETCVPLLSRFLGIEFEESMLEAWRKRSKRFEAKRRPKEPLSDEQIAFIQENKDREAEKWLLNRLEEQRAGMIDAPPAEDDGQIQQLERRLTNERQEAQQLREQNQRLALQIRDMQKSKTWRLVERLDRIKALVLGRK
jgi:sulfotransferase family protein